jgi:hypothetical protein
MKAINIIFRHMNMETKNVQSVSTPPRHVGGVDI